MDDRRCVLCGNPIDPEVDMEVMSGYLCEDCVLKTSPWFEEFQYAETEDLRNQIRLRQENLDRLRDFVPSRCFGEETMVVVDDSHKTFMVTSEYDLSLENPELISVSDVIDCSVTVEQEREDLGDKTYCYSYQFVVDIDLNHPYLDHICFPLNEEPLSYESQEKSFLGFGGFDPEEEPDYQQLQDVAQAIEDVLNDLEDPEDRTAEFDCDPEDFYVGDGETEEDPEEEDGEEETSDPQDPFAGMVICPWCGCRTRVDSGVCTHCGGGL